MPDYLTTAAVAALLGVTPARVRQLYGAGTITGRKLGRDLLLDPRSVERARGRPGRGRPPAKKKKRPSHDL